MTLRRADPKQVTGSLYDLLEAANRSFQQTPLSQSVVLSSVPKCGTLLLRNILLMFVPWEQIHLPFITDSNVFEALPTRTPQLLTGHLTRSPATAVLLRGHRLLVLVRDPGDSVLAHARFMFSEQMANTCALGAYARHHMLSLDEIIPFIITGWRLQFGDLRDDHPSVAQMFVNFALAWVDQVFLVRYEELLRMTACVESEEAYRYFERLLGACGIVLPDDWRERVTVGSNRALSGSDSGRFDVRGDRRHLTEREMLLLSAVAPGIIELLGYPSLHQR